VTDDLSQHLVDRSPELIHAVRADGSFALTNTAWRTALGYATADLADLRLQDILPPAYRSHCGELLARILDGADTGPLELTFVTRHGQEIPVAGRSHRFRSAGPAGGALAIGFFRDVSREQGIQGRLTGAEQRWELAIAASRDGLWDWDLRTSHVYYSPRWEELFGYAPGTAPQSLDAFMPLVHDEDRDAMFAEVQRYLAGEQPHYSREFRMRRLDGTPLWTRHKGVAVFEAGGKAIRMIGTTTDITEMRTLANRLMDSEAAARESVARLKATLDAISEAIVVTDGAGRVTDMNHIAEQFTGWAASEALGRPIGSIVQCRDDATGASPQLPINEVMMSGLVHTVPGPTVLTSTDGSTRDVTWGITPVWDERGRPVGLVHMLRDVTDERRTQALMARTQEELERQVGQRTTALRHTASLLQAAFEATADGLLMVDLDGRVRRANDTFLQLWGLTGGDLEVASDLHQLLRLAPIQPADGEAWLSGLRHLGDHPAEQSYDVFTLRDGRIFECYARPQIIGNHITGRVFSFRDITEREQQAESLMERERLLRESQHLAGIGSWSVDVPTQRITWTDETYAIFGVSREHFAPTRQSMIERIHPDDRVPFERSIEALARGEDGMTEFRTPAADGTWVTVIGHGHRVTDDTGAPLRIVGTVQNVTRQRAIESELRQAQKMEAIGRLAGGIAHDFNNVLTVITGHADRIHARLHASDPLAASAEAIQRSAERATAMTRQLLAFSRKQVLRPEVVDLNEVVEDLAPMLRRLIGADIDFVTRLGDGPLPVLIDRSQLDQVILNLAVNARDAMPGGGTLTVSTEPIAPAPGESAAPQASVRLSIADTGMGMTAETQSRIFEPFFTTKGSDGTGLGLATVFGIVAQSGGAVAVTSQPGRGARFQVDLPRSATEALARPSRPAPVTQGRGETILLVEDDDDVRAFMEEVLESSGYAVIPAANGRDALTISEQPATIDLLICDVLMPGMSGVEVINRVRAQRPGIPALLISGYTDDVPVLERSSGPADATTFLGKPFTAAELHAALHGLARR